jgi:hypothetical protein
MHSAEGAMFPIAKSTLTFGRIADYWPREISPPASWDETLGTLESAWWLGELRGNSGPTRLQRVKNMFTSMRHRDDLGIVFIVGDCAGPLPVELPDGSLKVDLRHEIRVPSSNTENWDEATCRDAFPALAKTSSKESYPELTVGFTLIQLSYEEFNTWRTNRGYFEPKFWRPREERKTWQARPGRYLTVSETAVVKAMNELWPDGHAATMVAQPTAAEKLPKAIAKRRRPAEERIRQELEKKAPEYIDTPGDKTCWSIAQILVETRGSARNFELDKTSKALKRYYANKLKD